MNLIYSALEPKRALKRQTSSAQVTVIKIDSIAVKHFTMTRCEAVLPIRSHAAYSFIHPRSWNELTLVLTSFAFL